MKDDKEILHKQELLLLLSQFSLCNQPSAQTCCSKSFTFSNNNNNSISCVSRFVSCES